MFGDNPVRAPVSGDGQKLDIQQIFRTLQGEGPYAGWPAVFVRLGGCNLACDFCDTEFESFSAQTLDIVVERVRELAAGNCCLAVITGGEPLRQPIAPLCEALLASGFKVQIETNGTLFRPLPEGVEIVCSPKRSGGAYHAIRADLLEQVGALKFIVSAGRDDYHGIAELGQNGHIPVYVQPMDEQDAAKNAANLKYAADLAQKHGYRLSVQLHKWLGIE